jgi:signal transduction histidine kinase
MKVPIGKRMNNGIVIAVVIVLAIAALSIWQYRRIRETGAEVRHADSVCFKTGEVTVAILQRELNVRKIPLTKDSTYLAFAYDSALRLSAKISELRSLTMNDPDVRSRVDSLVALIWGWVPGQGRLPGVTGGASSGGWTSYPPLGAGAEAAQRMEAILAGIGADERRLLDERRAVNQTRASKLLWALWALLAAVVVLAVVIFRKIRLELGEAREGEKTLASDVMERIKLEAELNEQQLSRQKQITEAVILAQEKERTEIGKELHDNVNQILGASNLYINSAMTDEEMRQELLERSTELVSNAINEIRKISKSLVTPGLREIGLVESIEDIIDDLRVAGGGASGGAAGDKLAIDLDLQNISEDQIEDRRKLAVFRIVQEQLNNIVKHARATRVLIRLSGEQDHIVLTVTDNGVGFDVGQHRKGVGITNIISRAELFNGKVEIVSGPGEGCTLTVNLPKDDPGGGVAERSGADIGGPRSGIDR